MDAGLGLKHGIVGIQIQHTAVIISQEAEAAVGEGSLYGSGLHPFPNLLPGADGFRALGRIFVRHRDIRRVIKAKKAVDAVVGDAGAVEGIGKLRDRAGTAVSQPFAGGGLLIIDLGGRLQVQDHHRRLAGLVYRQDGGRGDIGARVG